MVGVSLCDNFQPEDLLHGGPERLPMASPSRISCPACKKILIEIRILLHHFLVGKNHTSISKPTSNRSFVGLWVGVGVGVVPWEETGEFDSPVSWLAISSESFPLRLLLEDSCAYKDMAMVEIKVKIISVMIQTATIMYYECVPFVAPMYGWYSILWWCHTQLHSLGNGLWWKPFHPGMWNQDYVE